jgi:hypothetical protein
MNKLKLKALNLGAKELLSKEQMKNINGGTGCIAHDCSWGGEAGNCYTVDNECTCKLLEGGTAFAPICAIQN